MCVYLSIYLSLYIFVYIYIYIHTQVFEGLFVYVATPLSDCLMWQPLCLISVYGNPSV